MPFTQYYAFVYIGIWVYQRIWSQILIKQHRSQFFFGCLNFNSYFTRIRKASIYEAEFISSTI